MRILLLGKNGQVGWELQRSLSALGEITLADRQGADFENPDALRRHIRDRQTDVIVNATAYTAVDQAESEPEKARRVNAEAVGVLAEEAARQNALLVHYSTDYVFDGHKPAPYDENDRPAPLSVYGQTKLEGENLIREHHDRHLIFRTSWVYASRGRNFVNTILRLSTQSSTFDVVEDQYGTPTSAELIADVTALALHQMIASTKQEKTSFGTYHLTADGYTSWHGFARYIVETARASGIELRATPENVRPIPTNAYPRPAKRPANSRLATGKLSHTFDLVLPDWRQHVQRTISQLAARTVE